MVMRRNLYYNPNGVEQRMPQDAPRLKPNQYNVVGIFIRYLTVVGDAEPLPWPTPNNGGGDGGGGEIQECYLFERVQLLLVTLNLRLSKHQQRRWDRCREIVLQP